MSPGPGARHFGIGGLHFYRPKIVLFISASGHPDFDYRVLDGLAALPHAGERRAAASPLEYRGWRHYVR